MAEQDLKKNNGKTLRIIISIVFVLILVFVAIYVVLNLFDNPDTPIYYTVSPEEASGLINNSANLIVVDVRGLEGCSHCQFNKGHLPGAELNSNAISLYNSTNDLLVYSVNGTVGAEFCLDLNGHVYGKLYNLDGGYDAWFAAGFPTN